MQTIGYAAHDPKTPLAPFTFDRREPGPKDVAVDILFCGVCHSDLHTVRNEWGNTLYPAVAGHEIVGKVTAIGSDVTRFAVGQTVGIGCLVDSCRVCQSCQENLENYCEGQQGWSGTYNGWVRDGEGHTFGGYSKHIVVDEHFILTIAHDEADLGSVAPLLCAGITLYSPLRHWNVQPGQKVGIIGLGGLGHMGVKLASAMGAHVTVFTTSPGKEADAHRLGAETVVISKDAEAMKGEAGRYDLIINTVSAPIDINPYLDALKRDGTLVQIGVPDGPSPAPNLGTFVFARKSMAGSLIGGIAETQEMLDFCAEHGIVSDIEMIRMDEIEAAYERMRRSDVKYRFVIDLATLEG